MSLAPDRIADGTIGLGRLFTSAGVDPYDEIVWERRDARITNWIDGSVAFEQLDVEFPVSWSLNATNIVAQKYFRGTLGTPEREWSLKQVVDRIVDTIADWGIADGYFDGDEAAAFRDELKYILVTQRAAFNSPVWFNIGVRGVPQQASACFILAVEDEMPSILNWYREEGLIFKGGSGAGVNLSRIRSSFEPLEGGGTASGPVSFMRGADASAGTIKSGGKTRRAAKMVILDADHPDIEQFVWAKAIEERKARVLADAGFDMGLDGADSFSVQYQNANNSVRVTDEFMQAVVDDADWDLTAVTTGEVLRTVKARTLWREIAEAAWECADPGLQFDTTINRWHTAPNHGRITASNPVQRVFSRRKFGVQFGLDQSAEVPAGRRWVRRRGVHPHGRHGVHRAGDPRGARRLSDREDRRQHPSAAPARSRLRQPRRVADGARVAVRLRRRSRLGGRDHVADDRIGVRRQRSHRRPGRSVRAASPTTPRRCSTCSRCTRRPTIGSPRTRLSPTISSTPLLMPGSVR